MAYQIYFADLTEENQEWVLALLSLKEESGKLEPGEEELLAQLREEAALLPQSAFAELPPAASPPRQTGRRPQFRRRSGS